VRAAKSFDPDLTGSSQHRSLRIFACPNPIRKAIDPAVGVTEWLHLQEHWSIESRTEPVRVIPHTDLPYIHVPPPTPLYPNDLLCVWCLAVLELLFFIVNIRYLLYFIN
jgi:hypothetical protein